LLVADRAARLDDCADAGSGRHPDTIVKGEKGIGCHHGAGRVFASQLDSDLDRGDAVELPGPDADRLAAFGQDNGVGLDMLDHRHRQLQVCLERRVERLAGDGAAFGPVKHGCVLTLNQNPAVDRLEDRPRRFRRRRDSRQAQHAQVLAFLEQRQRLGCIVRRDHHLEEHPFGRRDKKFVHHAVTGDDPAVDRDRVSRIGLLPGRHQVIRAADAAGIGMLDRDHGRLAELAQDPDGRVRIGDVVVGQLFAVELLRFGQRPGCRERVAVEDRLLMRVLAIAQRRDAFVAQGQHARCFAACVDLAEVIGDQRVIGGGMRKYLAGQTQPCRLAGVALRLDFRKNRPVIARISQHSHRTVIFRCGAQHRRAADIDVLDAGLMADTFLLDGAAERIEVDDHQVDRVNRQLVQLAHMVRVGAHREQPAVDLGVQGLDPAVQAFGESGHVRNTGHLKPGLFQLGGGSASRHQLIIQFGQGAGQFSQACLVRYADQCSFHRRVSPFRSG